MTHKDEEPSSEELLRLRIDALEKALEYERLRNHAYKKLIEIAEAEEAYPY